ncbi:MAG: hypothetical protein ACREM3_22245 [Candidatus Rokuibacteriota bacterium]
MPSFIRTAIVLASGLFMASPVVALEHTYPGAMCVEVRSDNSLDQRQKLIRDTEGQLFNGSPAHTLEVVCPVVGPFDDLSGGTANVFVTDRHSTQDVCCEARLNNVGVFLHSDPVCSQGTDTRNQTLEIPPPSFPFTFTSRYFYCTIPPTDNKEASGIRLYRH